MVVMARTKDKNREYMRQYRVKNRDRLRAYNRIWMWRYRHGGKKFSTGRALQRTENHYTNNKCDRCRHIKEAHSEKTGKCLYRNCKC